MTSDAVSRRRLLSGGGALGIAGALGVLAPAPWAWSAVDSVLGAGAGSAPDPSTVWDPEADRLVSALFSRGEVEPVNTLLAGWTRNDQPLPAGLPTDLVDFLEAARRLPAWTDPVKLEQAFDFYERRGLYLGLLYGFGSGILSCVIPREARAVYYSAGGADMQDRIAKTATLGYDLGTRCAFGAGGQMIVTCLKTRLTHAAVRHLLPRSAHWQGQADEDLPISQADIMVTWHSLATFSRNKLAVWGIPVSATDDAAFLHIWQLTAHFLGVPEAYIPATWESAGAQSRQVLDPVLAPTREGRELARILFDLAAQYDLGLSKPLMHAFARYTLGEQVATWLEIPHSPMDVLVAASWKPFVRFRELGGALPLAPKLYWTFDEMTRLGVLFFLGEGRRVPITMPTGNNPHYA